MYSRIQNENGTYNTRCLFCFMTVGSAVEADEELARIEADHVCPEKALNDLFKGLYRQGAADANQR